jgi:hypothetical protein
VLLEGSGQLKNPMTSLGIEPATFRLVAECLNQLRYRVPYKVEVCLKKLYTHLVFCTYFENADNSWIASQLNEQILAG